MASFTKAILKVGDYQSPDGAVRVTPQRLQHWAKQFRRMRGKRLGIPVGWDHSDQPEETVPVAFSRGAGPRTSRNSAGWLSRFDVAPDGSHATIELDIRDSRANDSVANNVVEVSPIIYPEWTDGRGRNWRDVITHIDLVNHPVDDSQTDFQPAQAMSCCLRMGLDVGQPTIYRLSSGMKNKHYRMEDEDADDERPGADLEDMDDEEGETAGGDDDFSPSDEEPVDEFPSDDGGEEMPDDPMSDDGMESGPGGGNTFATQILSDLESVGIAVPNVNPDANPQEFLGQLSAALRQKSLDEQLVEADKAKQMAEDVVKAKAQSEGMMGSKPLEEKTPEFAAMSMQAQASHHYAQNLHRRDLMSRLNVALKEGRCTPHQKNEIAKEIGAVRLSLNSQGKPSVSGAEKKLELIESYPKGAAWEPEERLRMSREVPPPSYAGEISEDEAESLVDQVFGKKRA